MTLKERVRTTIAYRDPDRVPIFELTVANPVLESVLGRRIEGFGTDEGGIAEAIGEALRLRVGDFRRAAADRGRGRGPACFPAVIMYA